MGYYVHYWGSCLVDPSLDRFTWDAAVAALPPPRALNFWVQVILNYRNISMVWDGWRFGCVNASVAELAQLQNDWNAYGRRLVIYTQILQARKVMIQAFLQDMNLPDTDELNDLMKNMHDLEHQ
ncbi:hypothetical protein PHMEG_00022248 [Phytophthora megakarya]|uniref:Uncharacterized protein n=1 Tax=Phytophthora megakarya TaxID=4795 RepID=A0A225VM68_9STRA|nr:hypothetical protein PHMEG_00022248 [Phytophthora megakarya]